jgi:hypothetical protein
MNFKARELRFNVKDRSQFNEDALKRALMAERFLNVQVKSAPQETSGTAVPTP